MKGNKNSLISIAEISSRSLGRRLTQLNLQLRLRSFSLKLILNLIIQINNHRHLHKFSQMNIINQEENMCQKWTHQD